MYLGLGKVRDQDRLVNVEEIATAYKISKNHLLKVAQSLAHGGYIETVRGRNGGLRLARSPERINIGAVIRDVEEDFTLVECFNAENACVISGACRLTSILRKALKAYLAVLDEYSLADLIAQPVALSRLLLQPGA